MDNQKHDPHCTIPGSQRKGTPTRKRYAAGIKLAAILCIAMFFFPLFTVSCDVYGETYAESLSGWDCTRGVALFEGEESVEPHPLNSLLLILPAALLAIALFFRSKVSLAAVLLGIAQTVALLIFRSSVIAYIQEEAMGMVEVSFTTWYVIDILSAIGAVILGALGMVSISFAINQTDSNRYPQA